jgi:hypothetical protein
MKAGISAALLVVLVAATAPGAMPGAVLAEGTVPVYHDVCDSIGKGDVAVMLLPDDPGSPTQTWTVGVRAQSREGCSAYALGLCAGKGSLAEGVVLSNCAGPVDGGRLGPVIVCYPGPARPKPHSVAHDVPVVVDGSSGTFDGNVEADLYGTAVDEARNLCL